VYAYFVFSHFLRVAEFGDDDENVCFGQKWKIAHQINRAIQQALGADSPVSSLYS
jgi:hypothetical protein